MLIAHKNPSKFRGFWIQDAVYKPTVNHLFVISKLSDVKLRQRKRNS